MKHIIKKIHFVGIGGSGMSGIAEVLLNQGYQVSGSDLETTNITQRLKELGATIFEGHCEKNIEGADVVVISTAVRADNVEVLEARKKRISIVPRAAMLGELMRIKQGIAIAGTHGKTTTTSLVASLLGEGKLDPTFVIGGLLNSAGANARLGTGDFIVAEADESDASFLNLTPTIEVITNIDGDHMDTYSHDFAKLKQTFVEFTQRLPFYGLAVLCVDDPHVRDLIPFISRSIIRYGFSENAQVRAINVKAVGQKMTFTVHRSDAAPLDITLNLPGKHNVQNALAAIAIATALKIKDNDIKNALAHFNGVGRRFENHGEIALSNGGSYTLIDDYGHHPIELKVTLDAARDAFPGRRLVLIFQPHRFTRTRDCFGDFIDILSTVDALVMTEVYAAGEARIKSASGQVLTEAIQNAAKIKNVIFIPEIEKIPSKTEHFLKNGDVVMIMGAGSIANLPAKLKAYSKGIK